jgi:hypothetical protein
MLLLGPAVGTGHSVGGHERMILTRPGTGLPKFPGRASCARTAARVFRQTSAVQSFRSPCVVRVDRVYPTGELNLNVERDRFVEVAEGCCVCRSVKTIAQRSYAQPPQTDFQPDTT